MRTPTASRLAVLLVAGLSLVGLPAPASAAVDAPRGYVVVLRDSVSRPSAETDALERRAGFSADARYRRALKGFSARLSPDQVARLRADPDVDFVARDRTIRARGLVGLSAGDSVPPGVRRIGAATATSAQEASRAAVAVIDTGIDLAHPDLNAVAGRNCLGSGQPTDGNGHGTHVAGTIAARNNGSGVVGVVPGTRVYAVKVLDSSGYGTTSSILCGIDWVTRNAAALGIRVANMSLGGPGGDDGNCGRTDGDAMHLAVCNSTAAGVAYAVAPDNSATDFVDDSPGAYPEVLTVTAMGDTDGTPGGTGAVPSCRIGEADDRYASFSDFAVSPAEVAHTIAAPGVCVRSTWPGGGYRSLSGTSMAAPHGAGALALCHGTAAVPGPCAGATPAEAIGLVRAAALGHATALNGFRGDPFRPVGSRYYGYLAWTGADATPPPVDSTPPTIQSISPADGAADVGTASGVTVTFSEAMGRPSAQAAFALAPAAGGAAVAGTFAWSGNAMTFTPASPLAAATQYGATVAGAPGASPARDAAGNALAASTGWTFTTAAAPPPPPGPLTAFPGAVKVETGRLAGGSAAALSAADGVLMSVASATYPPVSSWYGSFAGVPGGLTSLAITYKGRNSRACTQTVDAWRFTDSRWVQLDSRSVGTSSVELAGLVPPGAALSYVSGTGEVRVRVRCTGALWAHTAGADLLKIAYSA